MITDLIHRLRVAHAEWLPTSEHTLRAHNLLEEAANALARADANLRYEQHRLDHVGTHGPGCEHWGPAHYECALHALAAKRECPAQGKPLQGCLDDLIGKHGSLRAVARECALDVGYLSRLHSGEKDNPSDATLQALGLRRHDAIYSLAT